MTHPQTECIVVARHGLGQDRAAVDSGDTTTTLVLADGAGGRSGGREAAEFCVAISIDRMRAGGTDPVEVLAELDRLLHADRDAGETTLVLAQLVGRELRGASVGDSGAWLIGDSDYRDLTDGQTRKPMLGSRAAQGTAFVTPIASETLLIASDGLLGFASPATICGIVRSTTDLAAAGRQLIDCVRLRSGALHDDTSLILLRQLSTALGTSQVGGFTGGGGAHGA